MDKITVSFTSEKRKEKVDRWLNISGIFFLLLSLLGFGSKTGISSYSTILSPYVFVFISVTLLSMIALFTYAKNLYREGVVVIQPDSFTIHRKGVSETITYSNSDNVRLSITDREGYSNYLEFKEGTKKTKLFLAFRSESDYYQLKDWPTPRS